MAKQYTTAQAAAQTRDKIIRKIKRRLKDSVSGIHVNGEELIAFIRSMDERASRAAGGWDKDRGIKNKPRATGKKAPKGQGRG